MKNLLMNFLRVRLLEGCLKSQEIELKQKLQKLAERY